MITVVFNKPNFEYDVHSLLKEFFPNEDVQMYYSCSPDEVEGRNLACTHHEISGGSDNYKEFEESVHVFYIDYIQVIGAERETGRIDIRWIRNDKAKSINIETLEDEKSIIFNSCNINPSDRKGTKNRLKIALYQMLEAGLGRGLPWGTLSGIRPTKIAMKCLEDGMSTEDTFKYIKENYLASDEKTNLSINIAKREKALLDKLDYENGYSLYVGIPFCPSTCAYCSFTSYPLGVWKERVDEYLDALIKEIEFTANYFSGKTLNSIYIGGGTPTTLEPYQMDRLLKEIKSKFDLSKCLEFTVEAGRPDSITREKLEVIHANGIERISVNPQTMKQETLDIIGRHHTIEDIIESFKIARDVGFENINMDLIMGLPEESIEDVRRTMEMIKTLAPDNVTIHSLAVKRAARLTIFKDRYKDMQMINTQSHMDLCEKYCMEMGLSPYYMYRQKGMAGNMENVGYAAPGKAGVYNILIIEEKQTIVACGAGASTKRVWQEINPDGTHRIDRCENVKDVAQYIARIDEMIERKQKLFTKK